MITTKAYISNILKNDLNKPKTQISLLPSIQNSLPSFWAKLGYFWIKIGHIADYLLKLQIKIGVHLINVELLQLLTLCSVKWFRPLLSTFFYFIHDESCFPCTGKSLSDALIFAKHWENMLCTKIVLNVRNYFYTQHVLPQVWAWNFHVLNF